MVQKKLKKSHYQKLKEDTSDHSRYNSFDTDKD